MTTQNFKVLNLGITIHNVPSSTSSLLINFQNRHLFSRSRRMFFLLWVFVGADGYEFVGEARKLWVSSREDSSFDVVRKRRKFQIIINE
jgi:hypothetical protein